MGATQGKEDLIIGRDNNNARIKFDPSQPEPVISDGEANLLKEVWYGLKDDILKVGVITFIK